MGSFIRVDEVRSGKENWGGKNESFDVCVDYLMVLGESGAEVQEQLNKWIME